MSHHINDFKNNTITALVVPPQLLTATTTNGTGTDFLTGEGNCWMELAIGAFNGTSVSVQVQQSTATNSGFADITGAVIAATTSASAAVSKVNFQRDMRYLRVIATISATTAPIAVILGESLKQIP
jgi:hypothetical protein